LHFTYSWSGKNWVVGIFSAINESIWEHMKMAFWPLLLYTGIEYLLLSEHYRNLFFSNMVSALITLSIIPVIVCIYTRVVKRNILVVDISTFIIAIIVGQLVSYALMGYNGVLEIFNIAGLFVLVGLAFVFALFTFYPPHHGLFKDASTKKCNY